MKCPKCGKEFDPVKHKIVTCDTCKEKGSTNCCITDDGDCDECKREKDAFNMWQDSFDRED